MPKRMSLGLLCLLSANVAFADQYFRNKSEYKTSDVAKKYFGASDNFNPSPGIDFGSIHAEVSTKMDCGRIDLTTNFSAQFDKIRKQAQEFVTNFDSYLSAVPTLAICQFSPLACSILRHDHFLISQNMNLRMQACAAIDNAINSQTDLGQKQMKAEATRNCIEKGLDDGLDMATATEECQDPSSERYQSGFPLRDLSSGVQKKYTNAKQKVLQKILGVVSETQSYDYLASLLGEIEIQSDGYWQPLWPSRMLKPHEVASNTIYQSKDVVCHNLATTLSANSVGKDEVKSTIREKLNAEDASDLDDLLAQDKKIACAALGRALGAVTVSRVAAKNEAILASALTNAALPDGLREEYRRRSSTAFETLRLAVSSEQIPDVEEVRSAVRELAHAQRQYNRATAASLSQSRIKNQSQKLNETVDCFDTNSCN